MESGFVNRSLPYVEGLNAAQMDAVTTPEGPVLVIAGAGSGKTRTIVSRVAWLVERGVDPASILLLTFTRKAAEEMLNRAAALLDAGVLRVSGGTFHSTGNLLLRKYGHLCGFTSSFSIMDQGDSLEAVEHARKSLDPQPTNLKGFPKARTIAELGSRSRGTGKPLPLCVEERYPHLVEFTPDMERVLAHYTEHKRAHNLMDYDDLLAYAVRALREHEAVRRAVAREWRFILVDEYQDTNQLQAEMLRFLASEHDNVMVVGDDSQSIYSFRGADFRNIMEFPTLFPDAKVVKLEENYRSTAPILALTNQIISGASQGYPKRLFTHKESGPLPLLARPETEREQSRFVAQCVTELRDHDIPLSDVAVLFRAGFHSFDLEGELTRSNIPFVKYGGFKFLESLHIKDALAHLKVVRNPGDRLSWMRCLRLLDGVGPKTAAQLAARLAEEGLQADAYTIVPKKRKYAEGFAELIGLLREIQGRTESIGDKVEKVNRYYFPFLKQNYDNYPKRMRDLDHLADLTASYRSLNRFLNDMALEPPDDDGGRTVPDRDTLVLSTIHSAKGLEWHTVILLWAAEGRLPSSMSVEDPDELEEERRLVYVAATRARRNLVVTAPKYVMDRRNGLTPVKLSRFFEEAPIELFRTFAFGR